MFQVSGTKKEEDHFSFEPVGSAAEAVAQVRSLDWTRVTVLHIHQDGKLIDFDDVQKLAEPEPEKKLMPTGPKGEKRLPT